MIQNIVFDMGQVLTRFNPDSIIEAFAEEKDDIPILRKAIFESREWVELDRGTLTEEALIPIVKPRLPQRLHKQAEELLLHWREHMTELDNILPLILELKNAGYSLYLLSNAGLSMLRFTHKLTALQHFTGILFSAEVHLLKPDPEIYRSFFQRFQLNPQECFFVDDQIANIDAGKALGMNGFVYAGETSRFVWLCGRQEYQYKK